MYRFLISQFKVRTHNPNQYQKNMKYDYDAIIIGSGMGGLSCGTLLAKEGLKVLICEQAAKPGGYCVNFKRGGFTFTPAIHYLNEFGPDGYMTQAFDTLGLSSDIQFCLQDPQRRIIGPDLDITLSTDVDQFAEDLIHLFPKEELSIMAYIKECGKLVKMLEGLTIESFDVMTFREKANLFLKGMFKAPQLLRYRGKTGESVLDAYFQDPVLKYILNFDARRGASLFNCACPIMWAINRDFHYVKNHHGVEALPRLFLRHYKGHGGEIMLNALVEKIIINDGRAVGVRIEGGQEFSAKYVVSNGDANLTFRSLVGKSSLPERFMRRLKQNDLSGPTFTVYLGVDLDLARMGFDGALIHYYPRLDKRLWEEGETDGFEVGNGKIAIRTDSVNNPSLAPEGTGSINISTFAPYEFFKEGERTHPRYEERKEDITKKVVDLAERVVPGLSSHTIVQDASTPLTCERYTLNTQGASMGWYLSAKEMSRIRTQETPISNLYLAGHWTFPGGGIPMVIISGINAARLVLKGRA